tara:strand:+ start:489 stop:788 length:300 start_codon:yes stop_codon:yes gene_type:complete
MTVIRPNSVAGINSITAQVDDLNLYKSAGTLADVSLNNLVGVAATFTSNVIGSATTITAGGVNVTGVVTATSFVGDGSGLTNAGASAATSVAIASFLGR